MKKHIRQLSEDGKSVQITIADERWYLKTLEDGTTVEYPSVTWIADHYPKGIGFYRWLANNGWDESESLKVSAGNRGSKVHHAISLLLLGNELKMDDQIANGEGELEDITLEEWEAIMSFVAWHKEAKPTMLANEMVVFNDEYKYAGTADFICSIDGEKWLIDFKTSKEVWPSYELQLSAYAHALPDEFRPDKLAILQVGYARNKNRYKLTEVADQFELFLASRQIWTKENEGVTMPKKDYPVTLTLC